MGRLRRSQTLASIFCLRRRSTTKGKGEGVERTLGGGGRRHPPCYRRRRDNGLPCQRLMVEGARLHRGPGRPGSGHLPLSASPVPHTATSRAAQLRPPRSFEEVQLNYHGRRTPFLSSVRKRGGGWIVSSPPPL